METQYIINIPTVYVYTPGAVVLSSRSTLKELPNDEKQTCSTRILDFTYRSCCFFVGLPSSISNILKHMHFEKKCHYRFNYTNFSLSSDLLTHKNITMAKCSRVQHTQCSK